MRDASKLTDRHRARLCVIYIRQSSYAQVERNRESTARQYDLAGRAAELGWPAEAVLVIDEDLGLSGSGTSQRAGFARLAAEVGLGHVGMILSLEVSQAGPVERGLVSAVRPRTSVRRGRVAVGSCGGWDVGGGRALV